MFRWLLEIRTSTLNGIFVLQITFRPFTSWNGNKRNSSVFITSAKFSRANLWERLWSSLQAWVSAKFLMPRQFVGWSCRMRNLQHASLTELIWRIEEAGSRTCVKTQYWFYNNNTVSEKNDKSFCFFTQRGCGFHLDIILTHWEFPSVGEIHQKSQSQRVNIVDCDLRQVLFCHVI